jgi:DNA-binding NarL/FixJ family response regulator
VANRVLIIDDNEGVRRLIRASVESIGLDVCGEAGDGFSGVERAKELQPDVILLDLSMPEMNGAEAASVLKSTMPDVLIVLFTMYEFGEALAAAVGVDVVLCKTDGVSKLTAYLKSLDRAAKPPTDRARSEPASSRDTTNSPTQLSSLKANELESFDIFRMFDGGDLAWLGAAETLDEAIAQVHFLGSSQPGRFVIRSLKSEDTMTIVLGNMVN